MLNSRLTIQIYLGLGLLLGGVIDILVHYHIKNSFTFSTILLFCLFYGLVYNEKNSLRLILTSVGIAVLVSLPLIPLNGLWDETVKFNFDTLGPYYLQLFSFLCAFPLFIYVAHAFHYAYHRDNTWRINYATLFSGVWDSLVLVIVASIFTSIATSLVALAAIIFKTVGSDLLWAVYQDFNAKIIIHTTLFFIGLYIAQQNQKIIHNLRFLLLRMMQFLFPLLALITIIYFFLYSAMLAGLISGESFPPAGILAALVISGVIFFNANFQTGEEEIQYKRWTRVFFTCYQVVLLCLCLRFDYLIISAYSIHTNVGLYLLIVLLHCLSYALGGFMVPVKQRAFIKKANISIALFFITAMLIINNSWKPITINFGHQTKTMVLEPGPVIPSPPTVKNSKTNTLFQQTTAIDEELTTSNLFWQGSIGEQSFIAAERDDLPLYICRAKYKKGNQIGSFSNNKCTITYDGKAFTLPQYKILAGKATIPVLWDAYPTNKPLIRVGVEMTTDGTLRDLYPCRVEINGKFYIGKVVAERCNIAIDGAELGLPIQAILAYTR